MPAVEIADSIVQSGRETLEKVRRIRDAPTLGLTDASGDQAHRDE